MRTLYIVYTMLHLHGRLYKCIFKRRYVIHRFVVLYALSWVHGVLTSGVFHLLSTPRSYSKGSDSCAQVIVVQPLAQQRRLAIVPGKFFSFPVRPIFELPIFLPQNCQRSKKPIPSQDDQRTLIMTADCVQIGAVSSSYEQMMLMVCIMRVKMSQCCLASTSV